MADSQGKAASKEITAELKAAKEEIKKKEYKEALKHCKVTNFIEKCIGLSLKFSLQLCRLGQGRYEVWPFSTRSLVRQQPGPQVQVFKNYPKMSGFTELLIFPDVFFMFT